MGSHATLKFLSRWHRLSPLILPPLPAPGGLFSECVPILLQNLNPMVDRDIANTLNGWDALVFALGCESGEFDEALAETVTLCLNKQDPATGSHS